MCIALGVMVDFPEGPDYEPTDCVPVVTSMMRKFLRILDGGTLYDLGVFLEDIASEASSYMSCMKHGSGVE